MSAGSTVARPLSRPAPRSRLTPCACSASSRSCRRSSRSCLGERIRGLASALAVAAGLALGGLVGDRASQLGDGPRDRLLDQLAIQRAVDDERRAVLELDHHAGGARLVDVLVGEADRGPP